MWGKLSEDFRAGAGSYSTFPDMTAGSFTLHFNVHKCMSVYYLLVNYYVDIYTPDEALVANGPKCLTICIYGPGVFILLRPCKCCEQTEIVRVCLMLCTN